MVWDVTYSKTGSGQIRFYADDHSGSTTPLVSISFSDVFVSRQSLGCDDFVIQNVIITGSQIADTISLEKFSFSFAAIAQFQTGGDGFTATASFTSSAVSEPAETVLLTVGLFISMKIKCRK